MNGVNRAQLETIERALDLAERHGDDRLLGRAIDAFGAELAEVDPVTRSMRELDQELASLRALRAGATLAGIELVPARRSA